MSDILLLRELIKIGWMVAKPSYALSYRRPIRLRSFNHRNRHTTSLSRRAFVRLKLLVYCWVSHCSSVVQSPYLQVVAENSTSLRSNTACQEKHRFAIRFRRSKTEATQGVYHCCCFSDCWKRGRRQPLFRNSGNIRYLGENTVFRSTV